MKAHDHRQASVMRSAEAVSLNLRVVMDAAGHVSAPSRPDGVARAQGELMLRRGGLGAATLSNPFHS